MMKISNRITIALFYIIPGTISDRKFDLRSSLSCDFLLYTCSTNLYYNTATRGPSYVIYFHSWKCQPYVIHFYVHLVQILIWYLRHRAFQLAVSDRVTFHETCSKLEPVQWWTAPFLFIIGFIEKFLAKTRTGRRSRRSFSSVLSAVVSLTVRETIEAYNSHVNATV